VRTISLPQGFDPGTVHPLAVPTELSLVNKLHNLYPYIDGASRPDSCITTFSSSYCELWCLSSCQGPAAKSCRCCFVVLPSVHCELVYITSLAGFPYFTEHTRAPVRPECSGLNKQTYSVFAVIQHQRRKDELFMLHGACRAGLEVRVLFQTRYTIFIVSNSANRVNVLGCEFRITLNRRI
jgi:hypothetical protein